MKKILFLIALIFISSCSSSNNTNNTNIADENIISEIGPQYIDQAINSYDTRSHAS